jgi:hypothetical protein
MSLKNQQFTQSIRGSSQSHRHRVTHRNTEALTNSSKSSSLRKPLEQDDSRICDPVLSKASDRLSAKDIHQFNQQNQHHHHLQKERPALVELVHHKVV